MENEPGRTWGEGRLVLRSADMVVAAVPHMLGFPPENSTVLVGLARDGADGSPSVRVVQRFDTPDEGLGAEGVRAIARGAAGPMSRSGVSEVVVVVFGSTVPYPDQGLPSAGLADELVLALEEHDIAARDLIYTDGSARWSYGCDDPACCPPEGRLISDEARTWVAAEFAAHGAAMVPSRSTLADELAPDPAAVSLRDAVASIIAATPTTEPELDAWRTTAITDATRALAGDSNPETVASAIAGLRDIRVRDTVLWDLSRASGRQQPAIDALTAMVRSAPAGHVAPAATTLAVMQWLAGDGARANTALTRALDDDPDYRLAHMVKTAIGSGMPPEAWRECVGQLPREVCRHGLPTETPSSEATPAAPPTTRVRHTPSTPTSANNLRPASPPVEPVVTRPPAPGLAS